MTVRCSNPEAGAATGRIALVAPKPSSSECGILALVFEFLKAVLRHEIEKALDFVQIYAAEPLIRGRFCLLLFWHLEFEKFP